MLEYLSTRSLSVPNFSGSPRIFEELDARVRHQLAPGEHPVRFAVAHSSRTKWSCETGIHAGGKQNESIFRFSKRSHEDTASFNSVMIVPTGVGAEIGGHAGDASPAAALIAGVCDSVVTHPNVLNASDLIQIPANTLYVEGSVITRMLMGTARLRPVRANRVLVLLQSHEDKMFTEAAINAVNAARAYYGLNVTEVVMIDSDFKMNGEFSSSGTAVGTIQGLEHIWDVLDARLGEFDAVAISSVIEVPFEYHRDYYWRQGEMVNPWGGVEAMLTHSISTRYGIPAAHSPMFESREIADLDVGVVDSRMAAEVISLTFLQSVLRGLQRSPQIITQLTHSAESVGVENVSCLVIPDGCLGLPVFASLHQGIPVIAVRENVNIMRNQLSELPWRNGQFFAVENYWEAVGVITSLKLGLDPYSTRRPLGKVTVSTRETETESTSVSLSGYVGR